MQSKISSRQIDEQRNFQARQQTYENVTRPDNPTNVTQKTANTVTTTPLFVVMGITFAISWIMLCRQRFFKRTKIAIEPTSSTTHMSN
jgi:cytochrome c-type biogenesis protein CcmH/NrfG